jgi:hypothetical protein
MMRHAVPVDTVERPRVSAPGLTRQDRSDGRDETRSMLTMRAKRGKTQPQPSPSAIGIIGHDCGRMKGGEDTSEGGPTPHGHLQQCNERSRSF